MSVHRPKFKNISTAALDSFIKHHLPYELWMMRDSYRAAVRGGRTRFEQNLQVEGFALHARTVIEFLKNGESCSFNPTDFTTAAFSVNRKFLRNTLLEMINQQISLLTVNRTEKQEEKFDAPDWKETLEAVENELCRWVQDLKPEWAAKWEQRERMGEAISTDKVVKGASSAPTYTLLKKNQNATAPAPVWTRPAEQKKSS